MMNQIFSSIVSVVPGNQISSLSIKQGQVFSGKIMQLFPNQLALVQLGRNSIIAQLEAPLNAHTRYWFQVTSTDNRLKLKVISNSEKRAERFETQSLERVLEHISIPLTKTVKDVGGYLLKEQLPFTNEIVSKGSEWIATVANKETVFQALKYMILNDLPMTDATFKAVFSILGDESYSHELFKLKSMLPHMKQTPACTQVSQLLNIISAQQEAQQLDTLLESLVKRLVINTIEKKDVSMLEQLLNKANIPLSQNDIELLLTRFNLTQINTLDSEQINTITDNIVRKVIPSSIRDTVLMNDVTIDAFMNKYTKNEQAYLQDILSKESKELFRDVSGRQLEFVLRKIGLNHERLLPLHLSHNQIDDSLLTLKSTLLALLHEQPEVHDVVEPIIQRITGNQLLNYQDTTVQQLVFQVPLVFPNGQMYDISMQWNGKKQSDGTLDPNHCRIMFYLQMERLGEIVCDVQIQNKIVSISIWNDTPNLETIVQALKPQLEQGLLQQLYTLSHIKVETKQKTPAIKQSQTSEIKKFSHFDLRV
ncbi:hypothetical protein EJF36_09070 [Bacillus sp. HMF5848]|uniref:hypothetical protein n=1 Tax=Bacillus sp. HMF5848 TaxID=2495421 RepID=UPI000F78E191|nr:hypothetical protein [Bacillus sp. HMF5848]RSK27012.1 hypothetical protein EJF36_09070 [Bacillus sp. HMF5848]